MYRIIRRQQSWTCRRCLLRLNFATAASRRFQTVSAVPPTHDPLEHHTVSHHTSNQRHDDSALRKIFDSRSFWREFSQRKSSKRTGLLQNQYLTDPEGFRQFASITLQKCQKIVANVLAASTLEEYRSMARDLDRLSDLLCRVVDLADFMRVNHPDPAIQDAAAQAFATMFEYMNVLNTMPGLNDQLKKAVADPNVTSHWSEEEKIAAQVLLKDFANSAIDLPPQQRQKFVTLQNEISQLGPVFVRNMEPETPHLVLDKDKLHGLDPVLIRQMKKWTKTVMPMYGPIPRMALGAIHDEETRKQIYVAYRTASKEQRRRLEVILQKRAELAKLTGYPTYAHMALSDKMAKSPEAVINFLTSLNASNRGQVDDELSKLLALKQIDSPSATELKPWDHAYYVHKYSTHHSRPRRSRDSSLFPLFFSLGTVMQGLSRLFTRLYGVRFVPRETLPGETWNDDVRRLDVLDEADNHLAVIYCDLFSRPGKSQNPAHFTLRCSRKISPAEIAEAASLPSSHPNDGMATAIRPGTNDLYQLPTIALLCDFDEATNDAGGPPSLLSEHDVQTLFHEMGHAIHSVLGRTDMQSICGTRCATDFAELPSVIMESFATCPQVLSLYARHWQTDAPLPEDLMRNMALHRENRNSMHGAMDNETQIILALLDQAYHSSRPLEPDFDSTEIFREVTTAHSSLPDPPDVRTAWQGYFSHLYTYGATYYSYLFDRAIAAKLWSDVFKSGELATDRTAGEKFKNEVLKWGGGRDGWKCVAGVLGEDNPANANGRLAEGREEAMREVGRWGLGDTGNAEL
ncbi:hypothetical protein VTO42DRAFT_7079 [Malbranchea cinnamomea]